MFGSIEPTKDNKSRQPIVYLMARIAEPPGCRINAATVCERLVL